MQHPSSRRVDPGRRNGAAQLWSILLVFGAPLSPSHLTAAEPSSAESGRRLPNVVFILADDLGWSDTTLFGTTKFYQTPNIERLARRGVTFRRAYAASPLCSPTRASILTGQNPARVGITSPVCHLNDVILEASVPARGPVNQKALQCTSATRLKQEYVTLAELLHAAGYATGHFGKWHLGREPYDPLHQGFDVDVPHWPGPGPAGSYVAPWKFPQFEERSPEEHIEDRMGDEAVAFIERHKESPFFLNYWQFSVHAPFDAKKSLIEKHRQRVDPDDEQRSPTYAAMVESLDDNVGKILDALDRYDIARETIIVFFSDNGGNMYNQIDGTTPTSNRPLRGGKATMYEGGIRVPCIVCWPGVVKEGSTSDVMIQSVDLYPTLLEILGIQPPPDQAQDGISITAALRSTQSPNSDDARRMRRAMDERPVFTFFPHSPKVPDYLPPAVSVHRGDWKLIRIFHDQGPGKHRYELYNLRDDLGERSNLAERQPAMVAELDALIERFLADTRAVVPLPNPDYDPHSVELAARGITGLNQCRLKFDDGGLHITATGNDPHFVLPLDEPLPAGSLTCELRMKISAPVNGHVFWEEQSVTPRFHRSRRVDLRPQADAAYHVCRVTLPATRPVTAIRIDPADKPCEITMAEVRLLDPQGSLLHAWSFTSAVQVPRIAGDYVTVYRPAGDRFPGPDTAELKAGEYYRDWVPNDHTILRGPQGRWQAIGITHPLTSTRHVHDGEFQSFHAMAPPGTLREVLRDGTWTDLPKVLPPKERPGEILENHAPFIVQRQDTFFMIYGPSPMRLATSPDLQRWEPQGPLFQETAGARDPNLLRWQNTWYLTYCTEDRVQFRTSADLRRWSEPGTLLTMPDNVAPESPSLIHHDGKFYLFVCGWNGIWDRRTVQGAYQHVTYVYASSDPVHFDSTREIARLDAHAPEVFQDEEGNWYISSAEWPRRGVSVAPLAWE